MIVFLLITLLLCILLFELQYNREAKKRGQTIPGPPTIPILGNAHQLTGTAADFLNTIHLFSEKYGDKFRVFIGPSLFIIFQNPSDVEVILSSSTLIGKSNDYNFFHPWLGEGLLTSTVETKASQDGWKPRATYYYADHNHGVRLLVGYPASGPQPIWCRSRILL